MSHDMVRALREACQAEEKVGAVFVRFGPRLRSSYAVYCRSHDMASSLVEKVSILFLAENVSAMCMCVCARNECFSVGIHFLSSE